MTALTRRVLVDGAGGFLGRHVVRALRARGLEVRATDREGVEPIDGVEWLAADLSLDPLEPLLRGITDVVHVAGLFDLSASREALASANVDVARRVAEAALIAGVRRHVHVSSVTVYGRPRLAGIAEDAPKRPEGAYERSKLAGEEAVLALSRGAALPVVVIRPSGIYGPDGRYGLAVMAAAIALAASTGRGHRSVRGGPSMTHVHVEDVAEACAIALDAPAERVLGRAFHVADATPVAWGDIAALIERFYGLPEVNVLHVTPLRARGLQLLGRLGGARVARVNAAMARRWDAVVRERGLVPALAPRIDVDAYDYWKCDHVYDTTALRALGWSPRWPDARVGLRSTLEHYVRERWLPPPPT